MNGRGNPQSLVVRHPGNTNAVKTGVYSPRCLQPQIEELDHEIASHPPLKAAQDILRREVASLVALGEAMDVSLAETGLHGRNGDPRTMISLRLRLNENLRRTLKEYREVADEGEETTLHADAVEDDRTDAAPKKGKDLLIQIALAHDVTAFEDVTPGTFDPDAFLYAVIVDSNPARDFKTLLRARHLLTQRKQDRPETCLCFNGRNARDAVEFHEWLEEAREAGLVQAEIDPWLASRVRMLARGETIQPWSAHCRKEQAFHALVDQELRRARGEQVERPVSTQETDAAIAPFWRVLLSPDKNLPVAQRLQALLALDQAGALRRCTCEPSTAQLEEERLDERGAYMIRAVMRRTFSAACARVRCPETYLAVQEAIDHVVRFQRECELGMHPEVGSSRAPSFLLFSSRRS